MGHALGIPEGGYTGGTNLGRAAERDAKGGQRAKGKGQGAKGKWQGAALTRPRVKAVGPAMTENVFVPDFAADSPTWFLPGRKLPPRIRSGYPSSIARPCKRRTGSAAAACNVTGRALLHRHGHASGTGTHGEAQAGFSSCRMPHTLVRARLPSRG